MKCSRSCLSAVMLTATFSGITVAEKDMGTIAADFCLYAPYTDGNGRIANWNTDSLVARNEWIQLTSANPNDSGFLFSKEPMKSDSWSVEFFFSMENQGDGLAFWFVEEPFEHGTAFGYKNNFKGLGVFLDSFNNQALGNKGLWTSGKKFPWISAMVGDGIKTFDHDSDGEPHLLPGCHRKIITKDGAYVRVSYLQKTLIVEVKINDEEYSPCVVASNVSLSQKGYLGFTSKNGSLGSRVLIYGITSKNLISELPGGDKISGEGKTTKVLLVFFVFAAIVGIYIKNQEDGKQRKF